MYRLGSVRPSPIDSAVLSQPRSRRIISIEQNKTRKPNNLWGCEKRHSAQVNVQIRCIKWSKRSGTETLEMDSSHYPEASRQHYTTGLSLEPPRGTEKRSMEKYMVPRSGSRCQRNRVQLGTIVGVGSGGIMLAAYSPKSGDGGFD